MTKEQKEVKELIQQWRVARLQSFPGSENAALTKIEDQLFAAGYMDAEGFFNDKGNKFYNKHCK